MRLRAGLGRGSQHGDALKTPLSISLDLHHFLSLFSTSPLSPVVAPDWLPSLPPPAAAFFEDAFTDASLTPAPAAADALVSHLAAVAPSAAAPGGRGGWTLVTAPAPEAAARLLATRFADPASSGLAELAAASPSAGEGTVAGWGATLAAAPDRAAAALPGAPASTALATGLARGAAALLLLQSPPSPAATTLLGTLIGRLALRGWATPAAAGLWSVAEAEVGAPQPASTPPLAPALAAVAEAAGPAAVEFLATALILHAAAACALPPGKKQAARGAAVAGPAADPAAAAAGAALAAAAGPAAWAASPGLAFLTQDKLLTRAVLPPPAAAALVALLAWISENGGEGASPPATPLAAATASLARAWAAPGAAAALPPPRAAYMAWALCACLDAAAPGRLAPDALASLVRGVGDRLDSQLPPVRRGGMRVGEALARAIGPLAPAPDGSSEGFDPAGGLFAGCWGEAAEGGGEASGSSWRLGREEWWDRGCGALEEGGGGGGGGAPAGAARPAAADTPSLEPLPPHAAGAVPWAPALVSAGAGNDPPIPTLATLTGPTGGGNGAGPPLPATVAGVAGDRHRPASLAAVAAALRRGSAGGPGEDDPAGVVAAVSAAATLVAAAPVELAGPAAADLARALLHARLPAWADEEAAAGAVPLLPAAAAGGGATALAARGHASAAPPHPALPSQQRLDTLVAVLAADPVAAGDAVGGALYSPHLDMHQRLLVLDALAGGARALAGPRPAAVEGGRGRAEESCLLEKGHTDATPTPLRRNRFAGVAVRWATLLLRECDVERHGVDLLGRDAAVLGRLLTCLATFAEAAGPCLPGAQVAAATLELVRAPAVHASPSPFVRRCALAASAAAAGAVPPAVVAGAVLAAAEAAAAGGRPDAGGAAGDAALLDRLAWTRAWVEELAGGGGPAGADPDPQCRLLASAAAAGFEHLAARALEAGGGGGGGGLGGAAASLFGAGRPLPSGGSAALGNRLERVLLPGAAARVRLD